MGVHRELLTTRETAELLGCSTSSVFRLVNTERLIPVRLSGPRRGRLRFEPDEIRSLIERSRERATERS